MLRGEKPKITFKKRVARGLLLWKLRLLPKNASPKGHNPPVLFSDSSASQNRMFESNGQPIIYNAILRKKNTILRQSRQGLTAVSFSEDERTHFFARAKIAGEVLCIFKPERAGNLRDRPAGLQ